MSKDIVILHGWGRGAVSYKEVKKLLEQKGYRVYTFDLPGFGEVPPPKVVWSVDDYADFVFKFIQSNNLDKVFLWGNSFGGRVAIKFAVSHPERLVGLILCAAAGIKHSLNFRQKIAKALALAGRPLSRSVTLRGINNFLRRIVYKIAGSSDYLNAPGIMKEILKKTDEEDLKPYLSKIKTLTLIIWGRNDETLPLSDAYIMNKEVGGSHLEILENVGHRPHKESPQVLIEKINQFTKGINS